MQVTRTDCKDKDLAEVVAKEKRLGKRVLSVSPKVISVKTGKVTDHIVLTGMKD